MKMSEKVLTIAMAIVVVYAVMVTVKLVKERSLHQQIEAELITKIDSLESR